MPCCLMGIIALIFPRLLIVILWFFTNWFTGMFPNVIFPILGLIFLPTTLLWYSAVQHWFGGAWTLWPIVGLIVALLLDAAPGRGCWRRFY